MCGIIAGAFFRTNAYSRGAVKEALQLLQHRGPDSNHAIYDKNSFIGHTRLSIVGLANGNQPLSNEDSTIQASVNGEFYRTENIRESLERKGHVFSTSSDSEILIHLYEERGIQALEELEGEFAFVIIDKRKNLLFAARDRFGIRPLYYAQTKEGLVLGSEEQSVAKLANIPLVIDTDTLVFSSCFQYHEPGRTWIKGVKSLEASEYLILKDKELIKQTYWKLPPFGTEIITDQEIAAAINIAITKRIPKEVPACIHLSGGLDSSIVAAESRLPAYSIAFQRQEYSELNLAWATANSLDIPLTAISIGESEISNIFHEAARHNKAPFINHHLAAKFILSRQINKSGYKVAITGEGADELFIGYDHFRANQPQKPDFSVIGIHTPSAPVPSHISHLPLWAQTKFLMLAPIRRILGIDNELEALQIEKFRASISCLANQEVDSWIKYSLQTYILRSLDDRMGMAHSVESRIPFLDHKLWELVRQAPLISHEGTQSKPILRRIYQPRLPASVIANNKHPFMAPPISNIFSSAKLGLYSAYGSTQMSKKELDSLFEAPDTPANSAALTYLLSLNILTGILE